MSLTIISDYKKEYLDSTSALLQLKLNSLRISYKDLNQYVGGNSYNIYGNFRVTDEEAARNCQCHFLIPKHLWAEGIFKKDPLSIKFPKILSKFKGLDAKLLEVASNLNKSQKLDKEDIMYKLILTTAFHTESHAIILE
jgi:hypothetical protein